MCAALACKFDAQGVYKFQAVAGNVDSTAVDATGSISSD
jgi:hypothetical protein